MQIISLKDRPFSLSNDGSLELFFLGVGIALAQRAWAREELQRALRLLREDVTEARGMDSAHSAQARIRRLLPSVARLHRVVDAGAPPPRAVLDLVDILEYEQHHDQWRRNLRVPRTKIHYTWYESAIVLIVPPRQTVPNHYTIARSTYSQ